MVCFNPRARRGRDLILKDITSEAQCFNPRARRGRDFELLQGETQKFVSIHAPAGGATQPRHGSAANAAFQSTRPQGARQHIKGYLRVFPSFNPRARRGRDIATGETVTTSEVSIHAPAGGATLSRQP